MPRALEVFLVDAFNWKKNMNIDGLVQDWAPLKTASCCNAYTAVILGVVISTALYMYMYMEITIIDLDNGLPPAWH